MDTRISRLLLEAVEGFDGWPTVLDAAARDAFTNPGVVSWDALLDLVRHLTDGDPLRQRLLGRQVVHTAGVRQLGHLSAVLTEESLYEVLFAGELPRAMPPMTGRVEMGGRGRVTVHVAVGPDVPVPTGVYELFSGILEALPMVLEGADAKVGAVITDRSATYDVLVAPSMAMDRLRTANDRLAESERRWRALVDNLPGVVCVLDPDGNIHEAFGSLVRDPSRLVGRCAFDLFRESDRNENAAAFRSVFQSGRPAHFEIAQDDPRGGVTRWWGVRGAPLPGPNPRGVFVAFDLTERRRAQEALTATEERYLRAQKMEAIGRLAGGLAHDFNNVLAAIRGQAEMLAEHVDPRVQGAVSTILGATERASDLTGRLLSYGRHTMREPSVVDLGQAMQEASPLLEALSGVQLELRWELHDGPLPVRVDSTHLQQVVLNLIVNARDAVGDSGVVVVRTRLGAGQAILEVVDNGTGMTEADRDRALEPFFTTKEVGRGSGLGLSTVYWIVDQVDGTIDLHSKLGEGTRVTVRFPLVEAPTATPVSPPARGALPRGHERILLAEDEPHVRSTVTQMLEAQGYSVLPCADGSEAMRTDPHHVDLLVTDVVMPGMSGTELARAMRKRRDDLPVLLLSGYTTEDPTTLDDGSRLGYLRKPFAMRDLAYHVRRLLDA